jgi:hypothetical protein
VATVCQFLLALKPLPSLSTLRECYFCSWPFCAVVCCKGGYVRLSYSRAVIETNSPLFSCLGPVELGSLELMPGSLLVVRFGDFHCLWSLVCTMLCLSKKNAGNRSPMNYDKYEPGFNTFNYKTSIVKK